MVKLYERSVAELMVEAAAQAEYPTSRARHHYAWLAKREPLFMRNPDGNTEPIRGPGDQ